MEDIRVVDVFETARHLEHEELDVTLRELLTALNDLMEIRFHQRRDDISALDLMRQEDGIYK